MLASKVLRCYHGPKNCHGRFANMRHRYGKLGGHVKEPYEEYITHHRENSEFWAKLDKTMVIGLTFWGVVTYCFGRAMYIDNRNSELQRRKERWWETGGEHSLMNKIRKHRAKQQAAHDALPDANTHWSDLADELPIVPIYVGFSSKKKRTDQFCKNLTELLVIIENVNYFVTFAFNLMLCCSFPQQHHHQAKIHA